MTWDGARDNPPPAPGRYCLAVCYCGDCDHYQPLPQPARRAHAGRTRARHEQSWDSREGTTWIDRL